MKYLNKQELDEYIGVSEQLRDLAKRKEELRRKILSDIDQGAQVPRDFNVIVDIQRRPGVPWQEEAHRWQQIARDYASRLGLKEAEFAKNYVDYPPVEVQVLRVSRKQ